MNSIDLSLISSFKIETSSCSLPSSSSPAAGFLLLRTSRISFLASSLILNNVDIAPKVFLVETDRLSLETSPNHLTSRVSLCPPI